MEFYDALETRSQDERHAAQIDCLRTMIARTPALAARFAPDALRDRDNLAALPLMRKSDLPALQAATPPLGGLEAGGLEGAGLEGAGLEGGGPSHVFMSPGPIYEPGGDHGDWWRFGRALHAAGLRAGALIHNSFSYHLTPAGMMLERGARAVGARVFPAGTGQTEQQAQAAAHLRPAMWAGTPDFLKIILDKAAELGLDLSCITHAMVSGGALFPSLRAEYRARGVACLQCYATADIGLIAYETPALDGMVVDEGVIVEIVRPGTPDPVPDGEVGEVVVTALNPGYPLIRFATGDLSAVTPGVSPCGRTNTRLRGWMGRADQTAKIKGMFVRPEQIAQALARHPQALRGRLSITRDGEQDAMAFSVEADGPAEGLAEVMARTLQDVLKLRGAVSVVARGALPNDGRVIDDQRKYE